MNREEEGNAICHGVLLEGLGKTNETSVSLMDTQISGPRAPKRNILYCGAEYLWILSIELTSCHTFGEQYFEAATRFLENLCAPG